MKHNSIKNILVLTGIVLSLIFIMMYIQYINVEQFLHKNLEYFSSPNNSNVSSIQTLYNSPIATPQPWNSMIMTHDTALDDYDITNPVLTVDDIIYQTTKYQALMPNETNNSFSPFFSPTSPVKTNQCNTCYSPEACKINCNKNSVSFAPAPSSTVLKFPCTIIVAYSNYKNKKGIDPFINKTIRVKMYDKNHAAYILVDSKNTAIKFPGTDGTYPLWALNITATKRSITCGWSTNANDAKHNNYPKKLLLYIKNVISS